MRAKTCRTVNFRQRLLLKLGGIVAEHGASLAYPVAINVDAEQMQLLSLGAVRQVGVENGVSPSAAVAAH